MNKTAARVRVHTQTHAKVDRKSERGRESGEQVGKKEWVVRECRYVCLAVIKPIERALW